MKVPVPQKGAGGQMKRMPAVVTVIREKEYQLEEEILVSNWEPGSEVINAFITLKPCSQLGLGVR